MGGMVAGLAGLFVGSGSSRRTQPRSKSDANSSILTQAPPTQVSDAYYNTGYSNGDKSTPDKINGTKDSFNLKEQPY